MAIKWQLEHKLLHVEKYTEYIRTLVPEASISGRDK